MKSKHSSLASPFEPQIRRTNQSLRSTVTPTTKWWVMFMGNWQKQLWKVNIDFHEEYLRKRNFKRLNLHLDFQCFFLLLSRITKLEKNTQIQLVWRLELIKVKVREYKWIPFTLMKVLTVIPIHITHSFKAYLQRQSILPWKRKSD